jgi:DNA adenine methylase
VAENYQQLQLFDDAPERVPIVNVASVPQRSPFRYPGGKTWLIPTIRQWIAALSAPPVELLEPFMGGGIVSLTVTAEALVARATGVELDAEIASVWQAIITDGDGPWLAERIRGFEMSFDHVQQCLNANVTSTRERAFQTIVKNRVQRGGIIAPGAGLVKSGENGKGLTSRWYPATLSRRILNIDQMRGRLCFVHGDGCQVLHEYCERADCISFIDPPYTASQRGAGKRLYRHYQLDHAHLFDLAARLHGPFLMTYENTDEVRTLAARHQFDTEPVRMKNTHHAEKTELLVSRDLAWFRRNRSWFTHISSFPHPILTPDSASLGYA